MDKKDVIRRLKDFLEQRRQVQALEEALQELTPAERIILDRMVMRRRKGAGQELCQLLEMEIASVYRYRDRALEKVREALAER